MKLNAFHSYRIAFLARMNGRSYHLSTVVTQKHPPTNQRCVEAARDAFAPYSDSRRNVKIIRIEGVTQIGHKDYAGQLQ